MREGYVGDEAGVTVQDPVRTRVSTTPPFRQTPIFTPLLLLLKREKRPELGPPSGPQWPKEGRLCGSGTLSTVSVPYFSLSQDSCSTVDLVRQWTSIGYDLKSIHSVLSTNINYPRQTGGIPKSLYHDKHC